MAGKRKGGDKACPVPGCGRKDFANEGAVASHVRLAKDSLHVAHRSAPPAVAASSSDASPTAAVSDAAKPPVPPEPAPAAAPPTVEVVKDKASPVLAAEAEKATAQEKPSDASPTAGGTVLVSFKPPSVVQPLAGTADQKAPAQPAASPVGEQKPGAVAGAPATVSDIPLEPFLAAGVASVINAFALDPALGDRMMTTNEVAATGFPKALEVSVRKYWPNLPLDHPLVLLGVSGTALVAQVKAHRAPRPKKGGVAEDQGDEGTDEPAPAPVPQQAPPPAPAAGAAPKPKKASAEAAMLAAGGLA